MNKLHSRKKPSKKLVKARAFFQYSVSEFVESIGAVAKECDYAKQYILQTSIGPVEISIMENWIAVCFDDACAASVYSRRNGPPISPFCGKRNFFYHDDPVTLNNGLIIGDFVQAVESLMAFSLTPEEKAEAAQDENSDGNQIFDGKGVINQRILSATGETPMTTQVEANRIDARVIAIDETDLCEIAPEALPHIERIVGVYLYDHNWRVHCCELTPSYETYWLFDEVRFNPETFQLSKQKREEICDRYEETDRELVHYFHCSIIDRLSERLGRGDYYREAVAVDDGETYEQTIDGLIEHLQCNHPF